MENVCKTSKSVIGKATSFLMVLHRWSFFSLRLACLRPGENASFIKVLVLDVHGDFSSMTYSIAKPTHLRSGSGLVKMGKYLGLDGKSA